MNVTRQSIVRGWSGYVGLFFALLFWIAGGEAMGEPAAFFHVGVESIVSLPVAAKQEPRTVGMEQAKKMAWERLLRRMFTRGDLEVKKALFETMGQNINQLAERVVVVGESRRADTLVMAVEVIFSAKAVHALLAAQAGLLYNETRHPPVLFLVRTQAATQEESAQNDLLLQKNILEAAKIFGIPVVKPLDDMEDVSRLAWELVVSGDVALRQWVSSRYATDQVWAVIARTTPPAVGSGQKTPTYTTQLQLLGRTVEANKPTTFEPIQAESVSITPPGQCLEQGTPPNCPYAVLANTLLQTVMDQWIQAHTINPTLAHTAYLRVIHGPVLAKFSQFVNKLRALPGVAKLKFMEERATESTIQMEFQGDDVQLQGLLTQLGAQVVDLKRAVAEGAAPATEPFTPIIMPLEQTAPHEEPPTVLATPPAVASPPARVEIVLRLL